MVTCRNGCEIGGDAAPRDQALRDDPVVRGIATAKGTFDVFHCDRDPVARCRRDHRGALRRTDVGEHSVQIEHDRLRSEHRIEGLRQSRKAGRFTRQGDAEGAGNCRFAELAHQHAERRKTGRTKPSARPCLDKDEVRLRLARR